MKDMINRTGVGHPPVVQLCVDVRTVTEAIEVARMGVRAGVDWLELGTPLVAWAGIDRFADFVAAFPDHPTFLDGKVMDASQPYVQHAAELGIDMVCLCASASDATFRAAVRLGRELGVKVVGDLYASIDPVGRADELVALGVDAIYLHYGYDQHNEAPDADPTLTQLAEIRARTDLPLGIVTWTPEMGEAAVRAGADILLVSHPYLVGPDAEDLLSAYVARVKAVEPARA